MEISLNIKKPVSGYPSSNRSIVADFVPFPVVSNGWKVYNPHEEHKAYECTELINGDLLPALILLCSHTFKGVFVALHHNVLKQCSCEEQEKGSHRRTGNRNLRTNMLLETLHLNCLQFWRPDDVWWAVLEVEGMCLYQYCVCNYVQLYTLLREYTVR